jgi:D-alanine-D-alanine ligase
VTATTPLKGKRTLGRVEDLSRHVRGDWWKNLFGALYLKTDGDVVENDAATREEVALLVGASGIKHDSRVLDLCCGQGRHAIELARQGFGRVTGVDYSRYLLRLARERSRREKLRVSFKQGDARTVELPKGAFDCIALMGSSLGYFEAKHDDARVLRTAKRALVAGGAVAIDVSDGAFMVAHHEPRSWEWIDGELLVCRERQLSDDVKRLYCREVVVHARKGVIADQFYAVRLYDERTIFDLLLAAGFVNPRVATQVVGRSTREEDLGMMQSRLFVVAHAPPSNTKANAKKANTKKANRSAKAVKVLA